MLFILSFETNQSNYVYRTKTLLIMIINIIRMLKDIVNYDIVATMVMSQ